MTVRARLLLPRLDRGVDGRGAPVFRQERGVDVQAAVAGQGEDFLAQDLPVGDDDEQVGLQVLQLRHRGDAPIFSGW